jgi:hypothetical protein
MNPGPTDEVPPAAGALPVLQLTGPQQTLYEVLLRKRVRLANIYMGALRVLEQRENPDRLSLCAHGLRELIEKLPDIVDIPVQAVAASAASAPKSTTMGDQVRELEKHWDRFKRKWNPSAPEVASKKFHKDIAALLKNLGDFFEMIRRIMPKRRDEVRGTLRGLDPAGQPLAPLIEDRLVQRLLDLRDYFLKVAHHKVETSEIDFRERLLALETFLRERLVPRTYEEFTKIDEIIARGKSDA